MRGKSRLAILILCISIFVISSCAKKDQTADTDTGADGDVDSDTDADGDADSDADGDADSDADADTDSDADADTDSDADADTDSDADADADSDADTDGDTDADTDGDTESDTNIKTLTEDACKIDADTNWTEAVYVADCIIEVESTLTIDPGVIVKFTPGSYLNVNQGGMLTAVGTAELPIVFTSFRDDAHGGDSDGDAAAAPARNDWGCEGLCGDLNIQGAGSVLEFVQDLYGSNGLYVQAESVQINDSVFAHHDTYGLVLDGRFDVETTALNRNAFFDNNGYPLLVGAPVFINDTNVFHDPANPDTKNAKQCIEVDTDIDQITWFGVTELGFLFNGHKISGEFLLPPDVVFKVQDDAIYLEAGGTFLNGPHMIFTSYKDDALGGDCTGDGPTTPADGDWEGLWIDDGTTADYAASSDNIRYAANHGTMPIH